METIWLHGAPVPIESCPSCNTVPFEPFMRGEVQRSIWSWWKFFGKHRAYCALICSRCKKLVGWERP